MINPGQSFFLLMRRSMERNADVSLAKIRRNEDFRDGSAAHPRVGELVTDQLFQLFPEAFGDAFVPMRVHVFRIQYVRENSPVFALGRGCMAAAAAGLLGICQDR